ncbi:MAG: hypothetical protein ABR899_01195 [Candidatus Krumholzibacteriaceae bacterium]
MRRLSILVALSLLVATAGCGPSFKEIKRETLTPSDFRTLMPDDVKALGKSSPYMKVHMHSGNVYVLEKWSTDETRQLIEGNGTLYSPERDILHEGRFRIGVDSVAIFETNVLRTSMAGRALTVFMGITAAVTIACLTNPKACFGSCPTFYVHDGNDARLVAEGFSASIAPRLEATDVDDVRRTAAGGEDFSIEMRNEALETHVVRFVNVLAAPRPHGGRVFADRAGRFWESSAVVPPSSATGPEGDCLALLVNLDDRERYSKADSTYLGAKETVEMEFDRVPGDPCGLVIGCRQTLLSTYLLYQTYAYMGKQAGYWLAQIERGNLMQAQNPIQKMLGGIEVMTQDSSGAWTVAGGIGEYGPLATDVHLVPLGRLPGAHARVRLIMTKGNWRIDYAALAVLSGTVEAVRVQPYAALKDGRLDDAALALLCDPGKALTTLPGDAYTLKYHLPDTSVDYQLFLESRGYYLEWIRSEWIEEENPSLLAEMFLSPRSALTRLAPEFKKAESGMEDSFWRSRYAKP